MNVNQCYQHLDGKLTDIIAARALISGFIFIRTIGSIDPSNTDIKIMFLQILFVTIAITNNLTELSPIKVNSQICVLLYSFEYCKLFKSVNYFID